MQIAQLSISNFRGIKQATVNFSGHTLLLGSNNVGKSTICDALDLVLGPDRINRLPPVQEFDFYNSRYQDGTGSDATSIPIEIDVVLTQLSEDLATTCQPYLQYWHEEEKRVLDKGELSLVDSQSVSECLRLRTIAEYDRDEDDFTARTVFLDGDLAQGGLKGVSRNVKKLFGFLYLRTLRTGTRALSLERGSLLDLILRNRDIKAGIWEEAIQRLKGLDPPIDEGAVTLSPVLEQIEKRLAQYIPISGDDRHTHLHVSQLTREHLRKTMSFFLKTSSDEQAIPFQNVGTGTLNSLVLALLTLLADTYKKHVIFAMEEPEIALPPHTQRRICDYLIENTSQCIVTSHSPYVLERFQPDNIQVLRKTSDGALTGLRVPQAGTLKGKTYRKHARKGLAEAMLGKAVIVGEGITEKEVLLAAAEIMEEGNPDDYYPLDLSGVTILTADGDGAIHEFGAFFRSLQITTYAFYDLKKRTQAEEKKIKENFDFPVETEFAGMERLLVEEIHCEILWEFLLEIKREGLLQTLAIPDQCPAQARIKELTESALTSSKGNGLSAKLIRQCTFDQLPTTVFNFLTSVYKAFPRPTSQN